MKCSDERLSIDKPGPNVGSVEGSKCFQSDPNLVGRTLIGNLTLTKREFDSLPRHSDIYDVALHTNEPVKRDIAAVGGGRVVLRWWGIAGWVSVGKP